MKVRKRGRERENNFFMLVVVIVMNTKYRSLCYENVFVAIIFFCCLCKLFTLLFTNRNKTIESESFHVQAHRHIHTCKHTYTMFIKLNSKWLCIERWMDGWVTALWRQYKDEKMLNKIGHENKISSNNNNGNKNNIRWRKQSVGNKISKQRFSISIYIWICVITLQAVHNVAKRDNLSSQLLIAFGKNIVGRDLWRFVSIISYDCIVFFFSSKFMHDASIMELVISVPTLVLIIIEST